MSFISFNYSNSACFSTSAIRSNVLVLMLQKCRVITDSDIVKCKYVQLNHPKIAKDSKRNIDHDLSTFFNIVNIFVAGKSVVINVY